MSSESKKIWRPRTAALHAGYTPTDENPSLEVPVSDSVAFRFRDTDHAADLFAGTEEGFVYGRINNPTVDAFERKMAVLEGAEAALATSSGMAAIFLTVWQLARQGGEIVSSDRVYGGTFHLFRETLPDLGIHARFAEDPHDIQSWEAAITQETKLLFVETPSNPKAEVFDLRALAQLAHKYDVPLVVDSTIGTPALQQPIAYGADIVVHSATKYICGDGTALGGVVIGAKELMDKMRGGLYRDTGPTLAPSGAAHFIRGLGTLWIRMKEHSQNALRVARFLQGHPRVRATHYPGLEDSPHLLLVKEQMGGRASSLMAFEIDGARANGALFIERLDLVLHAAHLGYHKTLAVHPASTTHEQLGVEQLTKIGISETMIRMSIGREDPEDIIADIEQALEKAFA